MLHVTAWITRRSKLLLHMMVWIANGVHRSSVRWRGLPDGADCSSAQRQNAPRNGADHPMEQIAPCIMVWIANGVHCSSVRWRGSPDGANHSSA
ncbi:hypothetical protein QYF36_013561 [Acer negundo]|nr:hypothetical protein QYF36_013561 [Acer negundo]